MNGYELSRSWFDWCFENPDKISPNHSALFFFCIEHCNRLGWKEKFGLPTTMAKEAIGIRSYNTYINTLTDLVEWGFIKLVEKSKNQYSANIVALSNFNEAPDKAQVKALDKAILKHGRKHIESTSESISSIDKPITINKEQIEFDVFWGQYKRKVGDKRDCNRKWDKLSYEEQKKIIETLPNFFLSISDKKFYPYPATYLNQRRWEDEPTVLPNKVDTKAVFDIETFRNG